jgi:hypothetical protein
MVDAFRRRSYATIREIISTYDTSLYQGRNGIRSLRCQKTRAELMKILTRHESPSGDSSG